jgi:hypothetical protein
MERQMAELGLRPPAAGEETTSEMTEDAAGRAAGDPEGEMASEPAEEPEPGFSGELPEEPDERRPATGEPRVDAALARLDELEGLPATEHRAVFEDVHRRLRDVLGELDTGQPREAGHAAGPAGRPGR